LALLSLERRGTEILELGAVLEHVVDRGEERGRDGADCLLWSTSRGETIELGIEVAAFLRLAAQAHWTNRVLSHRSSLRNRVEWRLPALSLLRGHDPAQDKRCPAVGERVMSRPISDKMIHAANTSIPGIVVSSEIEL